MNTDLNSTLPPGTGPSRRWRPKVNADAPRLCWSRQELVKATGLAYRSVCNLEKRGLLRRVTAGVNRALYSDESVQALFRENINHPFET